MGKSKTQVEIISEKYKEINDLIITRFDRGTTIYQAKGGFTDEVLRTEEKLEIVNPEAIGRLMPNDKAEALIEVLKNDPRPQYHEDKDRIYGIDFCGNDIRFRVEGNQLTIIV